MDNSIGCSLSSAKKVILFQGRYYTQFTFYCFALSLLPLLGFLEPAIFI